MGRRDVKSQVELSVLHTKAQYTETQSIQGTDVTDFHGACFVVDVGTHSADDLTVTFQHRDGSDSWVDIPASDLDGDNDIAITSSEADTQIYVGYTGNKEDIGAVITDGGTGDAVVGVYVVKGYPSQFPAN
jgi:hypothetical protein